MPLLIVLSVLGLAVLAFAADHLVLGSGRLAERLGLEPVVVGVVVIGFGTSAPELVVAATAGLQGQAELAASSLVGSNIINLTLILGVGGLTSALAVRSSVLRREAPLSVAAVTIFAITLLYGLSLAAGVVLAVALIGAVVVLLRFARATPRDVVAAETTDYLDTSVRPRLLIGDGGVLHAWSPHLLPAPADWPIAAQPTGFWTMPAGDGWTPPERLARFLEEGEPPVYIGFGSSVTGDPETLTATVLKAIRLAGRRAVLATGWGALRPGAETGGVLVLEEAPHAWLLPRVAVAVHHGGIGTVAAALQAGVPQVVRPFIGDQPFWAGRLHHLGIAPAPLSGRLTPERLAAAIEDAAKLAPAARALAGRLEEEDGVAAAVARLEGLLDSSRIRPRTPFPTPRVHRRR